MYLTRKISLIYDATLALVYPQPCAVCGSSVEARADGVACEACWNATRIFSGDETICWKCGAPARGEVPKEKRSEIFCRRCNDESFDAARACGVYEGALRESILSLKRDPHVGARLSLLLLGALQREPLDSVTTIMPVPLHPLRERERGFNQAIVLGRALASLGDIQLDEWSLVRTVNTDRHRAGMDSQVRRESVDGAFEVRRSRLIEGESILLIDDVFTTGATVSACGRALKNAGAQHVFVLTVARPASI